MTAPSGFIMSATSNTRVLETDAVLPHILQLPEVCFNLTTSTYTFRALRAFCSLTRT